MFYLPTMYYYYYLLFLFCSTIANVIPMFLRSTPNFMIELNYSSPKRIQSLNCFCKYFSSRLSFSFNCKIGNFSKFNNFGSGFSSIILLVLTSSQAVLILAFIRNSSFFIIYNLLDISFSFI